jgi:hypothetical protein
MLTATVTVNLAHDEADAYDLDRSDRQALQHLAQVPDGAHLVVSVGNRSFLTCSAVAWLSRHVERLDVEIEAADPWAARRWYDAIRSGEVL